MRLAIFYLVAITTAEVVTNLLSPGLILAGVIAHIVILIALIVD